MVKVIILAAGKGKRLLPLTEKIPKPLLEINGKTILERSIDTLLGCGVKDIFIVVGYLANKIEKVVDKYKNANIQIIYNEKYETTDNMYSSMLGLKKCVDGSVMIMNGDLIVSKEILQESLKAEFSNMPIEMNPNIKDGQKVFIKDNFVKAISKTVPDAQGTAINILKLSKEDAKVYFDHIKNIIKMKKKHKHWWEQAVNEILNKLNVRAIEIKKGFWVEIDHHEDLERADKILKNFEND